MDNLVDSFVTGISAVTNALAMTSLMAWCLVILTAACLQIKLWTPKASTWAPQWQTCGTQRLTPSLKATAVRTASSSRRRPQAGIGKDRNQSPLCGALAARKEAFPCSVDKLDSTVALSERKGRSQKDCFLTAVDRVVDHQLQPSNVASTERS